MEFSFKGQVKVQEIQEAFDAIVESINNTIDSFNNSVRAYNTVNYNTGSASLAPKGYTLTIGGLKSFLSAYTGAVIGADVFKVNATTVHITPGIKIRGRDDILKLPSGKLTGTIGKDLYYDIVTKKYSYTSGEGYVHIRELNPNRRRYSILNTFSAQAENIDDWYYTVGTSTWNAGGQDGHHIPPTIDYSKKPCFIAHFANFMLDGSRYGDANIYFNNAAIGWVHDGELGKYKSGWKPYTPMFITPGISFPIRYGTNNAPVYLQAEEHTD